VADDPQEVWCPLFAYLLNPLRYFSIDVLGSGFENLGYSGLEGCTCWIRITDTSRKNRSWCEQAYFSPLW
jgi:hypothetical protein